MRFVTELAIRRRVVTVLSIVLLLAFGVFTYRNMPVELFPDIEFPLITVTAIYPSAGPDAVVRDVTAPIETAMLGIDGIDFVQSVSSGFLSVVSGSFEFGTDMAKAEQALNASLDAIDFPSTVEPPNAARVTPDAFPVLQLGFSANGDVSELQRVVKSSVVPAIAGVEGVMSVAVSGGTETRALVAVSPDALMENGVSLFQVSQALSQNEVALPAGVLLDGGRALPVKAANSYDSMDELGGLVVGARQGDAPDTPPVPIELRDVADIQLGQGLPTSIWRTNGRPGLGVGVVKEADANTIDVTSAALAALDEISLPAGVEVSVISNSGPAIQRQINSLQREAVLGFGIAFMVVFFFMLTLRPSVPSGLLNTLRPTLVIATSIPLSIFAGVVLLSWQDFSLNFMTLGGLAISVGRVVDDSIVVLENLYRHIQGGRERWRAALQATVEVGPAITASTLTTIAVFVPLIFLEGLVGSFFFPFAIAVSFALVASLVVALTAIPVLGAYLLRPSDERVSLSDEEDLIETESWMQRAYVPVLRWALSHKAVTIAVAVALVAASLALLPLIPVTLFPSGGDRIVRIEMVMAPGTSIERTVQEAAKVERQVGGLATIYATQIGSPTGRVGGSSGGFDRATILLQLEDDAPEDTAAQIREQLEGVPGRTISVNELSAGPPQSGLEVTITGADYDDISSVALELADRLRALDGLVNVSDDTAEESEEIIFDVDPAKAVGLGLTAQSVAFQVRQHLAGQSVATLNLDGDEVDVVLIGRPGGVADLDGLKRLTIAGPAGTAPLGQIASVTVARAPASVTRTDGLRSARIGGGIVAENTQAMGRLVQQEIDALSLPPGVEVVSGGVFAQIAEGFQSIFIAMIAGVALVYLIMVASLGSLRNPFVIITSLPLALIGALLALVVTGRTLGLPALMGILMLIGVVVTNAIVLVDFVERLRGKGMSVRDALIAGGRTRLRPILMTAITTSFALLPLAAFVSDAGGIISAELATVVIGGLITSTALTLIVVPVVYMLVNETIPGLFSRGSRKLAPVEAS